LYNRCEPAERRMLNRALFDRIIIDEDENISVVPAERAASVLAHVNTDVPEPVTAETNLPRTQAGQVSIFSTYVDPGGFEPPTFSLRTRRATNCAMGPWTVSKPSSPRGLSPPSRRSAPDLSRRCGGDGGRRRCRCRA